MTCSDISGLHHVGMVVRDLNAAIATFRHLGFHIRPPAYPALPPAPGAEPEPLGAGNTHADFTRSFIELLAPVPDDRRLLPADATLTVLEVPDDQLSAARTAIRRTVDGVVERLDRFEGAHILVFTSSAIEQTVARLDGADVPHAGARAMQRPVTTAGGTRLEAIMHVEVHADAPAAMPRMPSEGRVGIVQDAPPAALDAQTDLDHPNGALALSECVLTVDDGDRGPIVHRYERLLGLRAQHDADTSGFDLGGSRLTITTPSAFSARLPGERALDTPALGAYTVDVADLRATELLLSSRGIPTRRAAGGELFIPGDVAHGTPLMFRQAQQVT